MLNQTRGIECEILGQTGQICSLLNTVVLTKVNGFVLVKNSSNLKLDTGNKLIQSANESPLRYYSEINVPNHLKKFGRIFATVDDVDELEQSTAIMSNDGAKNYTEYQVSELLENVKDLPYPVINMSIPNTIFKAVIDNTANTRNATCQNWNLGYKSIGNKYRYKKITKETKEPSTFGPLNVIRDDWGDVAINDCSKRNPNGTLYLFETEKNYHSINLCCNESAVDFCVKNSSLVFYHDFLNGGKLRILSAYTKDINRKMMNPMLYRSSNSCILL